MCVAGGGVGMVVRIGLPGKGSIRSQKDLQSVRACSATSVVSDFLRPHGP